MIKKIYKNYDYVMIPRERKNIFLIIYFFILKVNSSIKLFLVTITQLAIEIKNTIY